MSLKVTTVSFLTYICFVNVTFWSTALSMKLTTIALSKVNTPAVRHELSGILQRTEQTIIRYIRKNEHNGPLTTLGAVELISHITKLTYEEIIERAPVRTIGLAESQKKPVDTGFV